MLDDLKYIHDRDGQDALGVAERQWKQLEESFELTAENLKPGIFKNVVFAGMGGSALAALLATTWPRVTVPFEIIRNYDIPTYVGLETLFIASSYSGNTEEELEAIRQAEEKQASIVVITSGGQLADIARTKNYPLLLLPAGLQPRHAVFYDLKAFVTLLDKTGLTEASNAVQTLQEQSGFVREITAAWIPTIPVEHNYSKQIALEIMGKSPVIYGGPRLFPAAYKWKINFNENAKNVAWCSQYPEFNHNEFLGWTSHPTEKPYAVIDLRSTFEHERVQKRFEVSERLLSGKRPSALTIDAIGDTLLQHLLWTVVLGDFVSLYVALLNGLNPTPVELIEKFKHELAS